NPLIATGTSNGAYLARGIAVSAAGDEVVVAGRASGPLDLGNLQVIPDNGHDNAFVAWFDQDLAATKVLLPTSPGSGSSAKDLLIDDPLQQTLLVGGQFRGDVKFADGGKELVSAFPAQQ